MRWSWLAERAGAWLVPLLTLVAEGALLTVVYVAVETVMDGRMPLLGTLELTVAAGIAALSVRRKWIDPEVDVLRFLALLLGLGLVGWLWDERVRSLLLAGDPLEALTLHPGGWLMVAAGMRGVARGIEIDDRSLTRLVLLGVPALAIPWTIGQLYSGALREAFTDRAFVASLTFVTAGFIAAGLARLQEIGRETGIDWRHDRSWFGTVLGVLVAVLALGIPASILLGLPGSAVARGILGPLVELLGYVYLATVALIAVTAIAIAGLLQSAGIAVPPILRDPPAILQRPPMLDALTFEELREPLTWLLGAWIVLIVLAVVLTWAWTRRRRLSTRRRPDEERTFQVPRGAFRIHLPRRERKERQSRTSAPNDAVTAYLASLDELAARDSAAARAEHETPRAHARRVRIGTELDALQADYALARYGNRELTDAEHRRALARWRRLRSYTLDR